MRKTVYLLACTALVALASGCISRFEQIRTADIDIKYPWIKPWVQKYYSYPGVTPVAALEGAMAKKTWEKEKLVLINEYLSSHPEVSEEIKQHLMEFHVVIGMTQDEVRLVWDDEPCRTVTGTAKQELAFGADTVWRYREISPTERAASLFSLPQSALDLYFKNNVLIRMEHLLKEAE